MVYFTLSVMFTEQRRWYIPFDFVWNTRMFTVYGMRSLYTSVRFVRACQWLTRKFPSWTLDNNFYSTSWPSLRIITKSTRKINSLCFTNPVLSYSTNSSKSPPPFRYVRQETSVTEDSWRTP